jgi:hypothetical protein
MIIDNRNARFYRFLIYARNARPTMRIASRRSSPGKGRPPYITRKCYYAAASVSGLQFIAFENHPALHYLEDGAQIAYIRKRISGKHH